MPPLGCVGSCTGLIEDVLSGEKLSKQGFQHPVCCKAAPALRWLSLKQGAQEIQELSGKLGRCPQCPARLLKTGFK